MLLEVDSIIESILIEHPDFDNLEKLKMQTEKKAEINTILYDCSELGKTLSRYCSGTFF